MKRTFYLILSVLFVTLTIASCSDSDDDITYKDISVSFASSEIGLNEGTSSADVSINLTRKSDLDITVIVNMASQDLVYGTDYTTNATVSGQTLSITIPAGNTSASFKITKTDGALFDGTETLKLEITSVSPTKGIVIGDKKTATVTFGAILSKGETLTLEGKVGDIAYANSVYVDFGSNTQTPIDRKSWNLGFYCGSDFRVVLNSAYATTATASTKTDITAVTIEDANAALDIAASPMTDTGLSLNAVDSFDGALSGTVFSSISATDSENKVYFVASEDDKSSRDKWYKVKVTRNGNGYKVQYARVSETTINTIEVTKDANYNFAFVSLVTGKTVSVEPQAKKWDIMWSYYTNLTSNRPYFMQDMVLINNIGGAKAVEVLTSTVSYENFNEANLANLQLSDSRNVIGSSWRVTANMGGVTGSIGVKSDRFYVIKTPSDHYYKLRFLKMGLNSDGGERGRPVIEYTFIK